MPEIIYSLDQASRFATMVIDTAGPVNTIGQQFITDLEKAVASALKDEVRGVVVISAKKKSFLDGANLKEVLTGGTPQLVRQILHRFQEALDALAKAPFPVVAILDGQTALGGGLELLLWACDHVFATPDSRVGQLEVSVGLFPAGGATQTLRRVVGFKAAVELIITARISSVESFSGSEAFTLCSSAELRPKALSWLADHQGVVNRNYDPNYHEPSPISDDEKQKILNAARFRYTICPDRPNMLAVIEALEAGLRLPFDQAVKNEIDLFVPIMFHPNTRNKVDLFFLATSVGPKLAKIDPSAAVRADRIAVIGAGLMGQGIAQVAADKGAHVTLIDVDEEKVRAAVDNVDRSLGDRVARGRWSPGRKEAVMSHIQWTTDYSDIRDVPLVIECVFEDLPLKRKILAQVQQVNPDAIFASNTSTIPMADISSEASRPEHVVGMHYFSPVPLMPLLEVIQGPSTSRQALATAVTAGRAMGKTVILVGDGPGFYTSRTFGNFVMNGFILVELGLSPWDVDFLALQAGFPQGPLHVYGTTGGMVVYHASRFMAERFPDRMTVPPTLTKLYEAGYVGLGKPSFYVDPRKFVRDESALAHVVRREGMPRPTDTEAKDILLLGMVNEAFWCLSEGILRDYYSMDLGAVLGIGFPDCWHGPGRYVSQRGVKAVHSRLTELSEKFNMPALAPAPEFERLIACGLDSSLV
ncbi:MAG: enoyl-CoA hydratase/isomerase family protein [Desulfomonile tiedjei]|nr:enoyl-CoA hydratase/isomerase family protein [Desulfomonile tiedjei]